MSCVCPHTRARIYIYTHTHLRVNITWTKRTLAVSSTVMYLEATEVCVCMCVRGCGCVCMCMCGGGDIKLRWLTLFCCPWFSYNIATTPWCRRLCSALFGCLKLCPPRPSSQPSPLRSHLIPVGSCCDHMSGDGGAIAVCAVLLPST